MINLYETKKALVEEFWSVFAMEDEYTKMRRNLGDIIWDTKNNYDQYSKCKACILLDIIHYETRGSKDDLRIIKNTLPLTYYTYYFLMEENGRSLAGTELSGRVFTRVCQELEINTIYINISRNWSSSSMLLEKVLEGLNRCEWKICGLKNKKLVLERNKEEVEGD